jgi:UDPglucose 6-dehydrogenase
LVSHRVGVVGAGYVGLTTAACLAHLGHRVSCVDIDTTRVAGLRLGEVPIAEPDLAELVGAGLATGRLSFSTGMAQLGDADAAVVCVATPTGAGGVADLRAFESALDSLSRILRPGCAVAVKSTVPVGTTRRAAAVLGQPVVSNPEFLREGHAVHDFLHPDRIVVGSDDDPAARRIAALYTGLRAPVIHTDPASAELAKYASNAFLAVKLSYVNVLAELCERLGADIGEVTHTMGLDERIGPAFLTPGPGWGGSCLPKDTAALVRGAADTGVDFDLVRAAVAANERQPARIVDKVREAVTGSPQGRITDLRIGLLGLTFKAGTDDLRHSPALAVASRLADQGAVLTGYDPGVPAATCQTIGPVDIVDDPVLVAKGAAGIVLLTEWPLFRDLDWPQLAAAADQPVIIDTRNLLDHATLTANGFHHSRLGTAADRG